MVALPDLEAYLNAMGDVTIMIGSVSVADGLGEFGAKEGDVSVAFNQELNTLTFPENTGPAVHDAVLQGENPVITIPTVIYNEDLWARLSPNGQQGGGYSTPQPTVKTSVVLIPTQDLVAAGAGGYSKPVDPGVWAPEAPTRWVWFWKCIVMRPDITLRNPDMGKSIAPVTIQVLHDKTRPEGKKLYDIGDPVAHGVTGIII